MAPPGCVADYSPRVFIPSHLAPGVGERAVDCLRSMVDRGTVGDAVDVLLSEYPLVQTERALYIQLAHAYGEQSAGAAWVIKNSTKVVNEYCARNDIEARGYTHARAIELLYTTYLCFC
jgi:hypothetical protein